MTSSILVNHSLTHDPRLDCIPEFDPRSRLFLSRDLLDPEAEIRDTEHALDLRLDQGTEGACVGFGFGHELAAEPVPVAGINEEYCRRLYKRAQVLDEWPGTNYEGTSVLAGAKVCKELGMIDAYFWATGAREVAQALTHLGPVVIGVNWHAGMERTDREGFIWPTGAIRGGHCVCLRRVVCGAFKDGSGFAFLGPNSWGRKWGDDGEFWITGNSLQTLIESNGAVCVPTTRADTGKWPEKVRERWWTRFLRR